MKKLLWKIPLCFFAITIGWVIILRFVPIYITPVMIVHSIQAIGDDKREVWFDKTWIPIEKISPNVVRAIIASEDDTFLTHHGFAIEHIRKAYFANKKGKKIRGASTISQQTAKNVFTSGYRTWVRKGFETYFTVLIECIWGKKRIAEVYLNVAEMGNGIYGVEAASRNYFNKSAKKINTSEAALLAACLPNPRRYSVKHPGPYMLRRQALIKRRMNNVPQIDFTK